MSASIRTQFDSALQALRLNLSDQQVDQLLAYIKLLQKWNRTYNLVGTSDELELLQRHLLDSIAISHHIQSAPVLDIGSGAGLPGIPLAITLPELSFTLLDANGKKCRFMRQAVIELNLSNVAITHTRVEHWQIETMPNTVIARAFAPLNKAFEVLAKLCAPQGHVLLMLGEAPGLLEQAGFKQIQTHAIQVPGVQAQRHLLVAEKE